MAGKVASKRLVIDASVARAAGESDHPTSSRCRDFLQGVLQICHHAVLNEQLAEEWRNHQSTFTRKWKLQMYAKKKVHQENLPAREELDQRLASKVNAPRDARVMAKDLHLVKAALTHDHIIVSMDEEARAAFSRNKKRLGLGDDLAWVNPAVSDDGEVGWLKRGAPREPSKKL